MLRLVSWKAAIGWALAFLVVGVVGARGLFHDDSSHDLREAQLTGRVTRVVDGDTIKVRLRDRTETVRYIGVDTPESVKPGVPVQCFAKQASDFNRRLVAGRVVRLRLGLEHRDRYGRLLAYVFVEGGRTVFVNAILLRRGYARTLAIPPNTRLAARFDRLERRAMRRGRGLWSRC
jgi:micrococcal nuclease